MAYLHNIFDNLFARKLPAESDVPNQVFAG